MMSVMVVKMVDKALFISGEGKATTATKIADRTAKAVVRALDASPNASFTLPVPGPKSALQPFPPCSLRRSI